MIVKVKDMTWKQITDFLKNTMRVCSKQYKVCRLISAYTRHNKVRWADTYKEAHAYVNPDLLELSVNVDTWEVVG